MASNFGGLKAGRSQQKQRALGLFLGVALVGVLVVLGYVLINQNQTVASTVAVPQAEVALDLDSAEVLVPIQSIEPGTKLEPMMFRKESRPKQGLPRRIVTDYEEIKGTYARSIIAADAPLLSDYITEIRPSSVITPEIPDGYRAVTIKVDVTEVVEGWARPGARVDVVWTSVVKGRQVVSSIVQNAKVLSAEMLTQNQMDQSGKANIVPNTVTLLVTAQDAKKIQLAKTSGKLSLSLRGDNDLGKSDPTGTITLEDMLPNMDEGLGDKDPSIQGTVKIGEVEYKIINGKMVPSSELDKR
jgi:Flp pilus assembly protein CpaB